MARGFNVSRFRTAAGYDDLLRTNRFMMEFQIPPNMPLINTGNDLHRNTARYLEFHCEVSASPGINLATTDARKYTYGPMQKRPFVSAFNDLTVTFFEDGKSKNFRFFNEWLRLINHSTLSKDEENIESELVNIRTLHYPYELSYREEYITQARLFVYTNEGELSRSIVFRDMYPIGISDGSLNWADNNSILRLGVNFHFLEWYDEDLQLAKAKA